jgi:hypothetical protein
VVESHIPTGHAIVELVFFYPVHIKTQLNVMAIAT